MIKIITIIGARPQIIKAAALSRAIRNHFQESITEIIVHTGQHYDANMSAVFFEELNIPQPNYNLNVGSGNHGKQTAKMIEGIEEILVIEKPNAIVLYGDTNSTLAGAIAASKIHIDVIHIEAGLRSFNKQMPEEINRIMCDHVSTLLFSPTQSGYQNLIKEGFNTETSAPFHIDNPKIYHSGDVMYDNSLHFMEIANKNEIILNSNQLEKNNFILATIHRNNNTDEPDRLNAIFSALNKITEQHHIDIVLPLHPRTNHLLKNNLNASLYEKTVSNKRIKIIEPVSFIEMIVLESNCKLVVTDSGGLQKEAFYFKKPCVILRKETEWVEIVECGAAILVDANETAVLKAYDLLNSNNNLIYPPLFGNGKAAEFICEEIVKNFNITQ
jgi:UDP-GlcNAc3NAcA epimerase